MERVSRSPQQVEDTVYKLKVKDLMSTELITLDVDETLDLANEIMQLARIRHLPVINDGQLVGPTQEGHCSGRPILTGPGRFSGGFLPSRCKA